MEHQNNTISSIIVTHQARLKCYLNNFTNSKIHRFMNGCILKITRNVNIREVITKKDNYDIDNWEEKVELIYNGMIDEEKPDYIFYQVDGPNEPISSKKGNYKIINFPVLDRKLPPHETKNHNPEITYIFYVIRHGQAEHNIKKNWGLSKQLSTANRDTNLTSNPTNEMDGEKQAIETGKNLYDYLVAEKEEELKEKLNSTDFNSDREKMPLELEIAGLRKSNNIHQQQEIDLKIQNIFVSDLKRTRQTLQNILIGMFQSNNLLKLGKAQVNNQINIYVLPCSHELAFPKCDISNMPGAVENTMNCSINDINETDKCKQLKIQDKVINFNWDKYVEFYGNGTRTKPGNKRQCKDTDMVSLAINEFLTNNSTGGKKKRKIKKTKKKTKKTKKTKKKPRKSKKFKKKTKKDSKKIF